MAEPPRTRADLARMNDRLEQLEREVHQLRAWNSTMLHAFSVFLSDGDEDRVQECIQEFRAIKLRYLSEFEQMDAAQREALLRSGTPEGERLIDDRQVDAQLEAFYNSLGDDDSGDEATGD